MYPAWTPSSVGARSGFGPVAGRWAGQGASFFPALETSPSPDPEEQAVSRPGTETAAPPAATVRSRVRRDMLGMGESPRVGLGQLLMAPVSTPLVKYFCRNG